MNVFLPGTFDTKGTEFAFLKSLLEKQGIHCICADAGVLNPPSFAPDISREDVFLAAGTTLKKVLLEKNRGEAVEAASNGLAKIALDLFNQGKIHGVLGMGGSAGTTLGTSAMRALPFGIPKIMVSTLASGQVRPFVGVKDITMMHSVVDICGLNRISTKVLSNAAYAMAGMLNAPAISTTLEKPLLAATMFGVTTPCVELGRNILEQSGKEVLVFHATGTGGLTMESFIRDGLIKGVLDITTTELADELVGGILSAGNERLTAAGIMGIPQVISVGALDMVNFGPMDTVPEKFRSRRLYAHNSNVTLMRTTPEENDLLGKEIALKANAAKGPTAIIFPLHGISALDALGQPFWWPQANQALRESLKL
ncbi:MAG: Tm-1-like ATP-binding domain-containing protein, partial [Planctomycetota bacterium]|nr:Tm-1-like ATP-binding domain-containing protein [Planctomycetota bacterium]